MGVGSILIGAWIARIVFVILVVEAAVQERFRVAGLAVVLMVTVWFLLSRINPGLVTPIVAIGDIALVFIVLGRDIRLS